MHEKYPRWGSDGYKHVFEVSHLIETFGIQTILDYGCGKGVLKDHMTALYPGLRVEEYDPGIPGKDIAPLSPSELVVCTDVLEHVEPEYLDSVLEHIRLMSSHLVFFVISTRPAKAILPDGRNAHLIVQDYLWWTEQLEKRFEMVVGAGSHKEITYMGLIRPLA